MLSREILTPVSPQFRMAGFNKFFQMPAKKNNSKFVRLIQIQKSEEPSPLPKTQLKSRSNAKLKQKTIIKPEQPSKPWFQKKSFVRFELDTTEKKPALPYSFAEEPENIVVDEAFFIESYFGRRPESKYLVPAEINLGQIPEKPELTRSRSLYDPIVERLLDDSMQNEDNNEKNPNTITSIEERKSRPQSMNFDTDMPLLRSKAYSSRKIRGSGTFIDDSSFERANGLTSAERNMSNTNNLKAGSLERIVLGGQEERLLRRKSCTCSTCGLNKKLAKNSAVLLSSDSKNNQNQSDTQSIQKAIPKVRSGWYSQHSGSQRELTMLIKMNRSQARKTSQKVGNFSRHPRKRLTRENLKRSPSSSSSQQSSLPSPHLKKLVSVPASPLLQYRQIGLKSGLALEISSPALPDPSVRSAASNSPLLAHEMKGEDLQFLSNTMSNDELAQQSMKMLKLLERMPNPDSPPESGYQKNETWKLQTNPSEIAETSKEYTNSPEPQTLTHSEEMKKHEPSRFSVNSKPKVSVFKQEAEQEAQSNGGGTNEAVVDQNPTVPSHSRKIILIERNLAKISAGSRTVVANEHRPSHNNFSVVKPVKTLHHDLSEANLQNTDRSEKSINQTVHEVLSKTGQHRGLLTAMEKSHRLKLKHPERPTPSPFKSDLSLPYLEYIIFSSSPLIF